MAKEPEATDQQQAGVVGKPEPPGVLKVGPVLEPEVRKSVQRIRERVRGQLAIALLLTMLIIYLAPGLVNPSMADKMMPISEKLLTGLVGLLGTAIAFYFRNE